MHIIGDLFVLTFTVPENLGTNPQTLLWLLPLTAAVAIAYKAMKLPRISPVNFITEVVLLFVSIVAFMGITALVLYILAWLVTE
jgi:hypothetical protein